MTLAKVAVAGLSITTYSAPDCSARLPWTVIEVPGVALPGAKVPPPEMVVLPTVPTPVSAAPVLTVVMLDAAIDPSTSSTPPLTVVVPL